MVRMVRMVRSLDDRTFQPRLWHPLAAADEWSASVSEALAKVTQRYGFLSEEVSFTRAAAIFAYVTFSIF